MNKRSLTGGILGTLLFLQGCNQVVGGSVEVSQSKPNHVITPQMEVESAAMAHQVAFSGAYKDLSGRAVQVGGSSRAKPQYILFVKDGCPCSIDAQPIFNRLLKKFEGSVDVLHLTDADSAKATKYASMFKVTAPIVTDTKLAAMKGFGAKAAVYSVLIARNGHIIKLWPGYSADMLREMNETLSKAAGVPVTPFDPTYAPKKKTSGCSFSS